MALYVSPRDLKRTKGLLHLGAPRLNQFLFHQKNSLCLAPFSGIVGAQMPPEASLDEPGRQGVRSAWWLIAAAFIFFDFWTFRFVIFSDGISYLEIARRYASGDWTAAGNLYWSPLFSWLLAAARILVGSNDRFELLSLHVVTLLACLIALALFVRLLKELAPPVVRKCQITSLSICSCAILLWSTLRLISTRYPSPDMIVAAVVLGISLLVVRCRRSPDDLVSAAGLGILLGLAYLAKTAMFPLAPVYMFSALAFRRFSLKNAVAIVVPFALISGAWIVTLHREKGVWTIGESGKLNLGWEVCGARRTAHWQGEPGDQGVPLHPTKQIFAKPDVFEFSTPIIATYAPWLDPSYWYAGISPHPTLAREAKTVGIYMRYAGVLLLSLPGCAAICLGTILSRRGRRFAALAGSLWYLLFPAVASVGLYSLVYLDTRYVAGSLMVIGLVVLTQGIPMISDKGWLHFSEFTAILVCAVSILPSVAYGIVRHDPNEQQIIASEMLSLGLRPGDKIAYVGLGSNAYWAMLDGVRVVAEVPVTFERDGTLSNYVKDDYTNVDAFWSASEETKRQIFDKLRKDGVRAIVSDAVSQGADVHDWHKLQGKAMTQRGIVDLYLRFF
jgi:hypothetical protein